MENGKATITFTPSAAGLFNDDETVNVTRLSDILVHEGRHIYDDRFYGLNNGPTNIDESRRTERNAYQTEAAYLKAIDAKIYVLDLTGNPVLLTSEAANIAAENSVKLWVAARTISVEQTNQAIARRNNEVIKLTSDYNKKYGTAIAPKLQKKLEAPVYTPPPSY